MDPLATDSLPGQADSLLGNEGELVSPAGAAAGGVVAESTAAESVLAEPAGSLSRTPQAARPSPLKDGPDTPARIVPRDTAVPSVVPPQDSAAPLSDSVASRTAAPGDRRPSKPRVAVTDAPVPARCLPGAEYNVGQVCFDERPNPVRPPFVPVPADTQTSPTPSVLWVKVSTEGRTIDIQQLRPSSDAAFEREVRDFAWAMTWHPALKNSAPVEAWTQMKFPPARQ